MEFEPPLPSNILPFFKQKTNVKKENQKELNKNASK
jgi:hypothetical protein